MAALPYMQLYVAEYLADTAHLTAAQHGAYLLLIFNYWQRGKALNNVNERLANVARMLPEEWEIAKPVLAEFFEIDGDEWTHSRIERDLSEVNSRSRKASNAGKLSAASKASKRSTNVEQSFNHTDTDTYKEKNICANAQLACPVELIVEAYHEAMPLNPRCKVLNQARRRTIRQRWLEASKLDVWPFGYETLEAGVAAWKEFFVTCAESYFLTGKIPGKNGSPPFIADIDFLFSPSGFAKCLENKYHGR